MEKKQDGKRETKMGFHESMVSQLFKGKTKTYRLREHNVKGGDVLDFENSQSHHIVGKGKIKKIEKKKISEIDLKDEAHGSTYENVEELIKSFKSHYPDKEVTPETEAFVYSYEFTPSENEKEVKEQEKSEKVIAPESAPIVEDEVEETPTWTAHTTLGKQVLEGKIKSVEEILFSGKKVSEPGIVDHLVPNLQSELVLIGGRTGKGGGIQRIPVRITAKMHRSGRRFRTSAMIVVGNADGITGIGRASSIEPRKAMEKALNKAKLNIIKVKRGCGDWECSCDGEHSIPFKTKGKSGSVKVELLPAPKGIGLVADNETKKILRLTGIKDIWVRTSGNTSNRINLISAIFDALRNLYIYEK